MAEPQVAGPAGELSQSFRTFDLHVPLLESGKVTTTLATTDILGCQVQVADLGGENVLHSHPAEDQVFVVLQGEATWYTDAAATQVACVVGPLQGVLIPRGTVYWYEKTSQENLVVLRFGAIVKGADPKYDVLSPRLGSPVPVVVAEGRYFGR